MIGANATVRKAERVRYVQDVDERSVADAYVLYAAPANETRKVQFIRPFSVISANAVSGPLTPALGIAYLAAVLEKAGYPISVIDAVGEDILTIRRSSCGRFNFQGLTVEQIVSRIAPETLVVGISMMFSQEWVQHRDLIRAIRRARPDVVIVAGGEHATALAEFLLQDCKEIDYIVRGEGELAFLELCHAIYWGEDASEIPGTASRGAGGTYRENGLSRRIVHLDELPWPAWHVMKVENFFIDHWTNGLAMGRNMPILATRGCPYQCTFCSNPTMWTTRYKMRDEKEVADEIEFLIEKYGANCIEFFDLTAIVKREWILAFCAELKKRKINITWQLPSGTRSEALDVETLRAIKEAGCRLLVYAPESGSEATLKIIEKRVNLKKLTASAIEAVRIGHTVKINLIVGFPHEKLGNVFQTLVYGVKMAWYGVSDMTMTMFSPYPGSQLFRELRRDGVIKDLDDDYFASLVTMFDMTVPTTYCKNIPGWQLAIIRVVGHSLFYLTSYLAHPSKIVRLIGNLRREKFTPSSVFEQRVSDMFARRKLSANNNP